MLDIKLMYHELDFCSCHRLGLSLASRPAPLCGLSILSRNGAHGAPFVTPRTTMDKLGSMEVNWDYWDCSDSWD